MKTFFLAGNKRAADVDALFESRIADQSLKLSKFSQVFLLSSLAGTEVFNGLSSMVDVVTIPLNTSGALATAGFALPLLDPDEPFLLMPTNSEIKGDFVEKFFATMQDKKALVGAIVFNGIDPLYSYARLGLSGEIIEVIEKKVSGSCALAGVYFFSNRELLSNCLEWAMVNNVQNQGYFFISPALNYFLAKSIEITLFEVGSQEYLRY